VRREASAPVADEDAAVRVGDELAGRLLAEGLALPPRTPSRPAPTPSPLSHPQDDARPRHDTESGS